MYNLDKFLVFLERLKIKYYSYYDDENNFYVYLYDFYKSFIDKVVSESIVKFSAHTAYAVV